MTNKVDEITQKLDMILDQLWQDKHLGKAYDHAHEQIQALLTQEKTALLERVEREVIELSSRPDVYNGHETRARDSLKEEQLQALQQIKDSL